MHLGRTPTELEETILHRDLVDIATYMRLNGPVGDDRMDWHMAHQAYAVIASQGGAKGKQLKDFLTFPRKTSAEHDLETQLKTALVGMTGKKKDE